MALLKGNQSDDLTLKYLLQNASGGIKDVTVDGTSVVTDNVAEIDLTGKTDTDGGNISATDFLSALGLGTSGVLPVTIAQGGTGATTADGIKANIGLIDVARSEYVIMSSGSITIPVAGSAKGVIFTFRAIDGGMGVYMYRVSSGGSVFYTAVLADSALSLSKATNALTISNSATQQSAVFVLDFTNHVYS